MIVLKPPFLNIPIDDLLSHLPLNNRYKLNGKPKTN